MKVTSKTKLEKIMAIRGGNKILKKHGVPCVSCPYAAMELDSLEIGKVCKVYGLDLKAIIKDLNSLKS